MLSKLLAYSRSKHFLIKLVVCMLLTCTVPVVVLVFLFFHNVQATMKQEITRANARYLNQTVNAMELVVKQIGYGYRQFVTSESLLTFDQFPLGDYYAAIGNWHAAEGQDRQTIIDYIDSKANVLDSIMALYSSNDFIFSVYYINPNRNIVLTSDRLQYPLDEFHDWGWNEHIRQNALGYPLMTGMRDAVLAGGGVKRVIPIVFRSEQVSYSVVINLDADAVYTNLISKLGSDGNSSLIVFSPEGEPLLYDASAAAAPLVEAGRTTVAAAFGADSTERGANGYTAVSNRWLVFWQTSALLGWTVSSVTDLNDMYGSVVNIRNLFVLITTLLLLATATLALVSINRMYMPVSRLLQLIDSDYPPSEHKPAPPGIGSNDNTRARGRAGGGGNRRPQRMTGEFRVISESLTNAYEARNRYHLKLRESLPAFRKQFVRSLLRPNTYDIGEIDERLRYFGIELHTAGIGLMLLSVEDNKHRQRVDVESEKLEQLLVADTIAQSADAHSLHWVFEDEEPHYVVLVNCGDSGITTVFAIAEAIKRAMTGRHGLTCLIGVGSYCPTVKELPQAYAEAREALLYRNLAGESEVIYFQDVRLQSYAPLPYSKEKEAALIVLLKNGDKPKALSAFAEMVQDIHATSAQLAFPQAQHVFLLLLAKITETVMELDLDMKAITSDERPHLLGDFLQKNDWLEMTEWFEALIAAVADHIGHAFLEKRNMHVERARRMVEKDCGDKTSLSSVAESLHLSPAYLSRIFKEHTGVTFSEFVTRTRIAKGKELLLMPGMKIQDISSQLGYIKVNHFIKLFKKATGVTPGEFRKLHS